jgi:hypothetical protein
VYGACENAGEHAILGGQAQTYDRTRSAILITWELRLFY